MMEKIDISIVIPAFNEARRLPLFLERVISYCDTRKENYEIIVADDGSRDQTSEIAASYKFRFANIQIVKMRSNQGKGYAVRRGLFASSGDIVVFLDADGSVGPEEISKNLHYISDDGFDIFAGSRVLRAEGQDLKVKLYRKIVGIVFNFFVRAFLFNGIKDTQCGFKMFKKEAIRPLFSRAYLRGFGFDVEILYLAHKMGYRIKEGPVSWHHVSGSKVNLLFDSARMFFNILQVRNWHCTPINYFEKYMGPDEYRYMYEMENRHWWFISRRNFAARLIKAFGFARPKILDVGTGTGGNLLALDKLGAVSGIDISERAVEFCRRRGLENVFLSPAEKIDSPAAGFDVITCLDVLEHVPNPQEALAEMKRVLKDAGRIIITVPAFRFLWSQHDEALCHLRRYQKDALLRDIHEAGLKADRIGYFFFMSFFAVAPIRIMRKFLVSKERPHSDTTTLPPKLLNEFLKFLFNVEMKIADKIKLPFGTTLYAVCSK